MSEMKNFFATIDGTGHVIKAKKPTGDWGEFVKGIAPMDPLTGEHEDAQWLQIEQVQDEFGQMVDTITINQPLKDQLQAEDLSKKEAKDLEDAMGLVAKDALFDYLIAFDETKVKDINDIKDFMKQIKNYFLLKYKEEVKEKKAK